MIQNYGVEYAAQNKIFMDKQKETTLIKYGVEHACQNEQVKEKGRKTMSERSDIQKESIKEKRKITNLEKYGVENANQNEKVKEKGKNTTFIKYGVEHASQCMEVHEKQTKNSYYLKEYILPSGKIIKIQGYEHFALDELLKSDNLEETDIITGCKNVPIIWYNDSNDKKHRHFVDIFIPSQNKCIEIKSTWTFTTQRDTVFLKQLAGKKLGYLYEIWVYTGKGIKENVYN
jgi:hypothetical protein